MISEFDALFLVALVSIIFYIYMTWNLNYWKKRGIDTDDNVSVLFGSLTNAIMGKEPFGKVYTNIYGKFPGKKVVGLFSFRTPMLLIRDPEIVRKVLITDFNSFLNNDFTLDPEADPIMGKNIFVLKDDVWKRGRALITPAFTSGKIKGMYPEMQDVAKDLLKYLKQHPEEIHVKSTMSRFTTEIVARCAFGIEGNNFKDSKPEMQELGKLIWEPDFIKNLKLTSMFIIPTITKLFRLRMVPEKVIQFFDTVLRDVITYREKNDVQRNDLVQYYLDVKKKAMSVADGTIQSDIISKDYSDDDVMSGCVTFFVEGYETTALTINNVLYYLALHKDIQDTLRAEIDETLRAGELTYKTLHDMNYLHCVYAETNRILPVIFSMQKLCTQRYEMDIGKENPLIIEEGTSVVIPVYAIQRDPQHWEKPDKFKPERFLKKEDEAAAKAKGIYMPFSDGPRMCPGARIATTMVKLAIVSILSQLEVFPTSKTPKEIDLDPNFFLITHKGGIHLRFAERSQ